MEEEYFLRWNSKCLMFSRDFPSLYVKVGKIMGLVMLGSVIL
jgi:hypothetical protein